MSVSELSHKMTEIADKHVVKFIVYGLHLIFSIEEEYFPKLLALFNYKKFSHQMLVRRTEALFIEDVQKLKSQIFFIEQVWITCDIWSSCTRSFLGYTIHCINSDYSRSSFVLHIKRLKGKHNYEKIANAIEEVLEKYDLNIEKVKAIITDSWSNFFKCFEEFGVQKCAITDDFDDNDNLELESDDVDIISINVDVN